MFRQLRLKAALRTCTTCASLCFVGQVSLQPRSQPVSGSRPVFEPCPEVSCKSKEELEAMFRTNAQPGSSGKRQTARAASLGFDEASSNASDHVDGDASPEDSVYDPADCPPNRDELGRATWTFVSCFELGGGRFMLILSETSTSCDEMPASAGSGTFDM
jgi:hypothetical protein